MSDYMPIVVIAVVAVGLFIWTMAVRGARLRRNTAALLQLGLRSCPEETDWLRETVSRVENNAGFRYEIRDPMRSSREPKYYFYVKIRHRDAHVDTPSVALEEILFPVERRRLGPLALTVKPSALAPSLASRLIGSLAAAPWDARPDDLNALKLPPDLERTNVIAALGPSGASLYDLIDATTLNTIQGLGDAGGLFVHLRDGWCTVSGNSSQIPFRLPELVAQIESLLSSGSPQPDT